jgi:predicted DNA binding CopG/RHH family protein
MKKDPTQPMPFATKAEEAAWWCENSELLDKHLRAAIKAGEAKTITTEELRRRIEASKKKPATVVALRIPEADLTLARKQAKQKGLPYQTYIKSLLRRSSDLLLLDHR